MYKCNIAQNLIGLRTLKGVTQEDVASALSVSNKTISKWETGVSAPDLSMLVELSKYYNVSTDSLLGIAQGQKQTTDSVIRSEFESLNREEAIMKAFDIARAIVPASFETISSGCATDVIPAKRDKMNRYCIATHEFYNFVVNSDDVNLSIMLMRNNANFAWLNDDDKRRKIARLFAFLSDTHALQVCSFIHTVKCSEHFTADYIAMNTGIAGDKVSKILNDACEIGLCVKITAHLKSGKVAIYESFGNGNILSLITLAYEHMCGSKAYNYNFNSRSKMIGGIQE